MHVIDVPLDVNALIEQLQRQVPRDTQRELRLPDRRYLRHPDFFTPEEMQQWAPVHRQMNRREV